MTEPIVGKRLLKYVCATDDVIAKIFHNLLKRLHKIAFLVILPDKTRKLKQKKAKGCSRIKDKFWEHQAKPSTNDVLSLFFVAEERANSSLPIRPELSLG
jgi:hypothetical protein